MWFDLLSEFSVTPDAGAVESGELGVPKDVLLMVFVLGPDASISPHEHGDTTNVFHVLYGAVTVERDPETETVSAPGVVLNERGQIHGAHNDSDVVAVLTVRRCPLPGQ